MVLKGICRDANTLKSHLLSYTSKNAVKPNFTPSGSQKPQRRWVSLGFLFDVASMEQAESCVNFQGFGNIRSTQPTGQYGFFLN